MSPFNEDLVAELVGKMTRTQTMSVEQLDATRAERFGRPEDVVAEIFPSTIELEPICEACGGELEKNAGGWMMHVDAEAGMLCGIPTVVMRERRS